MKKLFIFFAIFFSVSTASFGQKNRVSADALILAAFRLEHEQSREDTKRYNQKYMLSQTSIDILLDAEKGLKYIIDDPLTSDVLEQRCKRAVDAIKNLLEAPHKCRSSLDKFNANYHMNNLKYAAVYPLNLHDETKPFVPMLEMVQKELSEKAALQKMEREASDSIVHQVKKDMLSEHVQYMKAKYMNESAVE